ncbi:MAG: acetylornithine deacetylase [Myxococcota bacterium]
MAVLPPLRAITGRLVNERSVSSPDPRADGPNAGVIAQLATYAEDLGFAVRTQEVHPGKLNLIATLGDGPGGLVLSGHADTVPFDESRWSSDPFALTERDEKLYGLGAADMKGFFAAALHAASRVRAASLREPVVLIATADEESTMDGARALLETTLPTATRAVIGEPTGLRPVHAHKGILMEAIELVGRSGHSSDPSLGLSALDAMSHVLSALMAYREKLQQQRDARFVVPEPTLNLGRIEGGDSPNRICGSCSLSYDVRMLPGMKPDAVRAAIQQTVADALRSAGFGDELLVEYKRLAKAVPAFETPANASTLDALEAMTNQSAAAVMFCTEAPFFTELGMETVVCGAGSIDVAHQPDEFVTEAGLSAAADVYEGLIHRFCVEAA